MAKLKEKLNKQYIKLSIPQNTLIIANSVVVLFIIAQVIFVFPYMLIAPLLLVIAFFCLMPLLKANTNYSRPYIHVQVFLAVMAIVALVYFVFQLVNDRTGTRCDGLMGSQMSCVDSMWLSASGVFILIAIPAAVLCSYGIYAQARLRK
jgi:FlaA1/EpsC-like NDP-sugar epimerase